MANLPISGLPAGTTPANADPFPTVQGGVTSKVSTLDIARGTAAALSVGYLANFWYPMINVVGVAGNTVASTSIKFHPFRVNEAITVNQLGAWVQTPIAASNFQMGIFANDPVLNMPNGAPLGYTASTLSAAVAVVVTGAMNVNVALDPSLIYWFGIACDTTTVAFGTYNNADNSIPYLLGSPNLTDFLQSAIIQEQLYQYTYVYATGFAAVVVNSTAVTRTTAGRNSLGYMKVVSIP